MRHPRALPALGTAAMVAVAVAAVVALPASAAVTGCAVTYQNVNSWQSSPTSGGFNTTLAITNLGDPVSHWTLTFTLPSGHTRNGGWNATYSGTTAISATDVGWNGSIGTGQTNTSVGLQGDWTRSTAEGGCLRCSHGARGRDEAPARSRCLRACASRAACAWSAVPSCMAPP